MAGWWLQPDVLRALADEFNHGIHQAKVQQVRQTGACSMTLELYAHGETFTLLLEAAPEACVALTTARLRRDQVQAPAFQGLLRKHLGNARTQQLTVDPERRSATLLLLTLQGGRNLVVEWARDAPNVLLVHENGTLLGAAHPAALPLRSLRVGKPFAPAPEAPTPLPARQTPPPPAPVPPDHALVRFPTHAQVDLQRQSAAPTPGRQGSPLRRRIKTELDKCLRLCRALEGDLERAKDSEVLRTAAERAKMQLDTLPAGVDRWELMDPFQPHLPAVGVKVDPALNARRNMEQLFHKARRLERTREHASTSLATARTRAERLRALLTDMDQDPSAPGLEDRARTLVGGVPEPLNGSGEGSARHGPSRHKPFRAFRTSGGWRVLVGKTPAENDLLTHRTARGNDIFLHARDAPGAHVVLVVEDNRRGLEEAIGEAALLAAHFSNLREAGAVDVRWTEIKHVRRVPRHPGLVTLAAERVRRVRIQDPRLKEMLAHPENTDRRLEG